MSVRSPHFLLFSEARRLRNRPDWHFVIEAADGSAKFEAADSEPHTRGERLELLAVVRGLEALDQPSHVTIYTPSRYVHRGLRFGLPEWRSSGWQWERYGQMVPVKDRDLWRRIDRALQFHQVQCRAWRIDAAHDGDQLVPTFEARPQAVATFSQHPVINDVARLARRVRRLGLKGAWIATCTWLQRLAAIWRVRVAQLKEALPTRLLLGEPARE